MIIIPLGTRCTSASIVKELFNQRQKSYPFDWVDIPLENIGKFIRPDNIEEFTKNYFFEVSSQRHPDGTWFPHDFIPSHYGGDISFMNNDTIVKYTRRLTRLHNTLKGEETLVFLTVFVHVKEENSGHFQQLRNLILEKSFAKCLFITVNLLPCTHIEGDVNSNGSHFNFVSLPPESGSEFKAWKTWEEDIYEKITENGQLQTFFEA